MRCPHPDWLDNRLIISGPAADFVAFRHAAAGAGVAGWVVDYDQVEEELFLRMMTVSPGPGGISVAGARHIARQVREMVWEAHEEAFARVGHDRRCPFDLHALVPVPWEILRLGEDHPQAQAWLWTHWGTTWPLRRVELHELSPRRRAALPPGHLGCMVGFWSADWSPWPVIAQCRARWPRLRFELRVEYWWGIEHEHGRTARHPHAAYPAQQPAA